MVCLYPKHPHIFLFYTITVLTRGKQFELASRLVGVYKVNHMTKSVAIENRDYVNGGRV